MTEFDEDLKRHLAREADSLQGMPGDLRRRIVDGSGPRPALWLRLAPVAVVVLFVAAAGLLMRDVRPTSPAGGAAAIASASPTAAARPRPSLEPSPAAPTSPATSLGSAFGTFVCGAGGTGGRTGATGDLKAVRVAHQAGFDRVTFEFAGNGIPHFSISRQSGTGFTQDASGMPVDVKGNNAMKVVFQGASERDVNGNPAYSGSNDIILAPAAGSANAIAEVRQVGDFERVLSWGVGLSARPACARVVELASPSRLVIDVRPQA